MKPGGRVLLSTPNPHSALGHYRYLVTRETMAIGGTVYGEYAKLSKLGHMGHVREYGTTDVINFFASMGFRTDEIIYRGGGRFGKFLPGTFFRSRLT